MSNVIPITVRGKKSAGPEGPSSPVDLVIYRFYLDHEFMPDTIVGVSEEYGAVGEWDIKFSDEALAAWKIVAAELRKKTRRGGT